MATAFSPEPVAVLGPGRMGAAIARTLLAHGHPTTVWNRSPGRADALAAAGATRAGAPADAVRAAELVLVCVADAAAVHSVLNQVGGIGTDRATILYSGEAGALDGHRGKAAA